jgi:hypothetical protein
MTVINMTAKKTYHRPTLIKKILLSPEATNLVNEYLDLEGHYFDRAKSLYTLKGVLNYSERELAAVTKVSKTEINRVLSLHEAVLKNPAFYDAAIKFGTDKWVFVMLMGLQAPAMFDEISEMILSGKLVKYSLFGEQFKRVYTDAEKRAFNDREFIDGYSSTSKWTGANQNGVIRG